jgi:hypothetical protein
MHITAFKLSQTFAHAFDVEFCAWLAQAEARESLIYQGFLVVDTDPVISKLRCDERIALCAVAAAAFEAARQGLVHLVQRRLATDLFAYIAVARPRPRRAGQALSVRLLEAA